MKKTGTGSRGMTIPWSKKSPRAKLDEARSAIFRLEKTLNEGDNRFGSYGDNVRASIKRWKETLKELEKKE